MPRSHRTREVELFNFSFLDILACVIGLLIFILSIVVVSGGGRSAAVAANTIRLSDAQQRLKRAHLSLNEAAARLARTEQLLDQRGRGLQNPADLAVAVRKDISSADDQTAQLQQQAAAAQTRSERAEKLLRSVGAVAANSRPNQVQIDALNAETDEFNKQANEAIARAKQNVQRVQFYIPHVHEVHRGTCWVEISAGRMWCIESADYDSLVLDGQSTLYTRKADAIGALVQDVVAGSAQPPAAIQQLRPEDYVLDCAVHADGYDAFRRLREWAWAKGFAVNWAFQEGSSIQLTRSDHITSQ